MTAKALPILGNTISCRFGVLTLQEHFGVTGAYGFPLPTTAGAGINAADLYEKASVAFVELITAPAVIVALLVIGSRLARTKLIGVVEMLGKPFTVVI